MTSPSTPSGYILALYGPSGVGKSTISRLFSAMCAEHVVAVPILTTRGPKEGDDSEYVYVDREVFTASLSSGDIIASTRIPSATEERWYGYRDSDIRSAWDAGKIPVVITEIQLLEQFAAHYGRRSVLSFGLLPPGKSRRVMLSHLLYRLRNRGRETEGQIAERLRNAESDLDLCAERKDLFDQMIINDDLPSVLSVLRGRVLGSRSSV